MTHFSLCTRVEAILWDFLSEVIGVKTRVSG